MRELNQDEIFVLARMLKADNEKVELLFNDIVKKGGWVLQAIEKRLKAYDLQTDKQTMILILSLSDGVVGVAAKYVDDVVRICKELNITKLDLDLFCEKIYPFGVPF